MDSDDPDLEAFEFNLRAIIRAREFGKTAALVSNLCPNASDSQSIGVSSKNDAQRDFLCGTSSHRQSDSDDSPDDFEKFASILLLVADQQGKLMKTQFVQLWTVWRSKIYQLFLLLPTTWKCFAIRRSNRRTR